MGMYDRLKVKNIKLPRLDNEQLDLESLEYQTKDFEDRLWLVEIDGNKVYINTEETHLEASENSRLGMVIVVDNVYKKDCVMYGNMFFRFYTNSPLDNSWIEFEAEYKEGVIKEIKRIA